MTENLLNEEMSNQIRGMFDNQLKYPVEVMPFYNNDDCLSCDETTRLLEEVAELSELINCQVYDLNNNRQLADSYRVQLSPGIVIAGREGERIIDFGIRMAGIPSGYEFSSLIQDIILVSRRDSGLKNSVRDELKKITQPIDLQVFVTPT